MRTICGATVLTSNRGHSFTHWLIAIVLPLFFLTPSHSHANPISLALLVDGVIKTAGFAGAAMTLTEIFGGLGGQADDHPLYSVGDSSPTLSISASETTFNLLLKQPNDVSEFEDDLPAVLSGIVKINTTTGPADAWRFSLTIEADNDTVFPPLETSLDAQGFVQHIFAPHPEMNEISPAPALNYDLGVSVPCLGFPCTYTTSLRLDSETDENRHPNGPHMDSLGADLQVQCCSTQIGNIDYFNVMLEANHIIPEPSALLALTTGIAFLVSNYRRNYGR